MPVKLCICQICNCGRHRCPHCPSPRLLPDRAAPCLISEYGSRYQGQLGDRARSVRPPAAGYRDPDTPMERKSTQHRDYIEHPLSRQPDFKPQQLYEQATVPMDLDSTYNTQFTPKEMTRLQPYKPTPRRAGGGKFRGDPTYNADFKQWPTAKREVALQPAAIELPKARFGNPTEAQSRFTAHPDAKAADSAKPATHVFQSTDPFAAATTHQLDYVPKSVPDRTCRPHVLYEPPTQPMDANSSYQQNYTGLPTKAADSCKPAPQGYRYSGDPTGRTTHQADYVPVPLPAKEAKRPQVYEPCDIPMDLHSMTHTQFPHWKDAEKTVPFRPKQRRLGGGRFHGTTTNHADFTPKDMDPARQVVPAEAWTVPGNKFDHVTEHQSRFQGQQGPSASSAKPATTVVPGGQFCAETTYELDYKQRRHHCPVLTINKTHDFIEDIDSHKFYVDKPAAASSEGNNILAGPDAAVLDSVSHEDYKNTAGLTSSRPSRTRLIRRASEGFLLGSDSPTYHSTEQDAYTAYPADALVVQHRVGGALRRLRDGVVIGDRSKRDAFLSTNHADYLPYDVSAVRRRVPDDLLNTSHFALGDLSDKDGVLSTNQADYRGYQTAVPRRGKPVDLLNQSGFALGQGTGDWEQYRTSAQDYAQAGVVSGGRKRPRRDLFRSSSGLLFGGSARSQDRFLTTSHNAYQALQPDRPGRAGRAADAFRESENVYAGQEESSPGDKRDTTTSQAYGRSQMGEGQRARAVQRDLFKTTHGFALGYGEEESESPRYSRPERRANGERRPRSAELPGDGSAVTSGYNRRRFFERSQGQDDLAVASDEEELYSDVYRQAYRRDDIDDAADRAFSRIEAAGTDGTVHSPATRQRIVQQLREELQNVGRMDANGFLWFPMASEAAAMEDTGMEGERAPTAALLPKWAESALAGRARTRADDEQATETGMAERTRKRAASADAAAATAGREAARSQPPPNRWTSQQQKTNEEESQVASPYPDSMDSGRTRDREPFDALDSLDRDRSTFQSGKASPGTGPGQSVSLSLDNERARIKLPKLIPVPGPLKTDGQTSTEAQEAAEARHQQTQVGAAPIPATRKGKARVSRSTSITGKEDESGPGSGRSRRMSRADSLTTETETGVQRTGRTKGRRRVADTNQRNQNPKLTAMQGIMDQGFTEQTTTTQQDFVERAPAGEAADRMLRGRRREPVSSELTSQPVQHSPRAAVPINIEQKRSELQTVGPDWQPVRQVRYADNLTVGDDAPFQGQTTTGVDYMARGRDEQEVRVQSSSLDRRTGQIGTVLTDPAEESAGRRRYRSEDRVAGMQALSPAKPFKPQDNQIFPVTDADRNAVGRSVSQDAYQAYQSEGPRPAIVQAKDALLRDELTPVASRSVNQESTQAYRPGMERALPVRRADNLSVNAADADAVPSQSVSQETYQGYQNTGQRPGPRRQTDTLAFADSEAAAPPMQSVSQEMFQAYDESMQRAVPVRRADNLTVNAGFADAVPAQSVSQNTYKLSPDVGERAVSLRKADTLVLADREEAVPMQSVSQEAFQASVAGAERALPIRRADNLTRIADDAGFAPSQSHNQETYGGYQETGQRPAPIRQQDTLVLADREEALPMQSVSQAAFQGRQTGAARVLPVRKDDTLNLTGGDAGGAVSGPAQSVSQATYQGQQAGGQRPAAVRKSDTLHLGEASGIQVNQSVSQEAYQAYGTDVERPLPVRRDHNLETGGSDTGQQLPQQTVSQDAYQGQQQSGIERALPFRKSDTLVIGADRGDRAGVANMSVSQEAYPVHPTGVDRALPVRREDNLSVGGNLADATSNMSASQESYRHFDQSSQQAARPAAVVPRSALTLADPTWEANERRALSVSQAAYPSIDYADARPAAFRPPPAVDLLNQDGNEWEPVTTNQETYKQLDARQMPSVQRPGAAPEAGVAELLRLSSNAAVGTSSAAVYGQFSSDSVAAARPGVVRQRSTEGLIGNGSNEDGSGAWRTTMQEAYHDMDVAHHLQVHRSKPLGTEDSSAWLPGDVPADRLARRTSAQDMYQAVSAAAMAEARRRVVKPGSSATSAQTAGDAGDYEAHQDYPQFTSAQRAQARPAPFRPPADQSDLFLQNATEATELRSTAQQDYTGVASEFAGRDRVQMIIPRDNLQMAPMDSQNLQSTSMADYPQNTNAQRDRSVAFVPRDADNLLSREEVTGDAGLKSVSHEAYRGTAQADRAQAFVPRDELGRAGSTGAEDQLLSTMQQDYSANQGPWPAGRPQATQPKGEINGVLDGIEGGRTTDQMRSLAQDSYVDRSAALQNGQRPPRAVGRADQLISLGGALLSASDGRSAELTTNQQAYKDLSAMPNAQRVPIRPKSAKDIFNRGSTSDRMQTTNQEAFAYRKGDAPSMPGNRLTRYDAADNLLNRNTHLPPATTANQEAFAAGRLTQERARAFRPEDNPQAFQYNDDTTPGRAAASKESHSQELYRAARDMKRAPPPKRPLTARNIIFPDDIPGAAVTSEMQSAYQHMNGAYAGNVRAGGDRHQSSIQLGTDGVTAQKRTVSQDTYGVPVADYRTSAADQQRRRRREWRELMSEPSSVRSGRVDSRRSMSRASDTNPLQLPPITDPTTQTTNQSTYGDPGSAARFSRTAGKGHMTRQSSSGAIQGVGYVNGPAVSTSQSEFVGKPAERRQPIKHTESSVGQLLAAGGDGRGSAGRTTTSKEAYRDLSEQLPALQRDRGRANSAAALVDSVAQLTGMGKNDAQLFGSVSQQAYQQYDVAGMERTAPVRPDRLARLNPITGDVQLFKPVSVSDQSGTAVRLVPVQGDVCPAALLEAGKTTWKFLGQEFGHHFYNVDT